MKWISVTESLPSSGDVVLTCRMPVGDIQVLYFFIQNANPKGWKKRKWCYYFPSGNNYEYGHRVTHWMPLPPYPESWNGWKHLGATQDGIYFIQK